MAGELDNMTKQIQVVEYFSRLVFQYGRRRHHGRNYCASLATSTLTGAKCTCSQKTNDCGYKTTMQVKGQDLCP